MKRTPLVILFFLVLLFGILIYRRLDNDESLTLPFSQKISQAIQHMQSKNTSSAIDHIVVITMENKSYEDIVGNTHAPYINSLIQKYSFADQYFAVSHPSLPNYVSIIGGSTFGITNDCTDCFINAQNLVDQLDTVHKTWKAYMESMPSSCFVGSDAPYAQKHNPFIYFDDIRNNPTRCQQIVPYTSFGTDFGSLETTPNFAWISPDLCHDMHDCSVRTGDRWLSEEIPHILTSPAFMKHHSLLVITWDEGEGAGPNHIPTMFIGNMVKKGYVTHTNYTHYSLLHMIENLWNLPPLTMNTSNSALFSDVITHR